MSGALLPPGSCKNTGRPRSRLRAPRGSWSRTSGSRLLGSPRWGCRAGWRRSHECSVSGKALNMSLWRKLRPHSTRHVQNHHLASERNSIRHTFRRFCSVHLSGPRCFRECLPHFCATFSAARDIRAFHAHTAKLLKLTAMQPEPVHISSIGNISVSFCSFNTSFHQRLCILPGDQHMGIDKKRAVPMNSCVPRIC